MFPPKLVGRKEDSSAAPRMGVHKHPQTRQPIRHRREEKEPGFHDHEIFHTESRSHADRSRDRRGMEPNPSPMMNNEEPERHASRNPYEGPRQVRNPPYQQYGGEDHTEEVDDYPSRYGPQQKYRSDSGYRQSSSRYYAQGSRPSSRGYKTCPCSQRGYRPSGYNGPYYPAMNRRPVNYGRPPYADYGADAGYGAGYGSSSDDYDSDYSGRTGFGSAGKIAAANSQNKEIQNNLNGPAFIPQQIRASVSQSEGPHSSSGATVPNTLQVRNDNGNLHNSPNAALVSQSEKPLSSPGATVAHTFQGGISGNDNSNPHHSPNDPLVPQFGEQQSLRVTNVQQPSTGGNGNSQQNDSQNAHPNNPGNPQTSGSGSTPPTPGTSSGLEKAVG